MSRAARSALTALAAAATALVAGCGSAAPVASGPAPAATAPGAAFLATSLGTSAGTWALAVMGGGAAAHNNFWQLFFRPAGSQLWRLVTPPGTADNGGLVVAAAGSSVITAFRPSQYLTYTPLAATRTGGQAWASTGPLDGALANVPDALAAQPDDGQLLALLADGTAEVSAAPGYTSWHSLTTRRSIATAQDGRSCGLQALTAAGYTPSGVPLLAGDCSRPGVAGIFAGTSGTWQPAGPALPPALSRQRITVLRLTRTASQTVALLAAGSGRATSVLAAWSADNGGHWALSPVLALGGASPASASFGSGGTAAVITATGRGEVIAGPGGQWQGLPALPSGTAALAPGLAGQTDALAVRRASLTVWQVLPRGTAWTKEQTISVPIQYGSSG